MKLVVIACLFALCYAQPPPPPTDIPETFTATLEITRSRGEQSTTGRGIWDRDAERMDFVYRDTFKDPSGREESFEMLGLYSTKMRYAITSGGPNGTMHCREEKIPEDAEFPKVWEWLSDPKTTKEEKTVNGTTYIVYTGHERDETIMLEVAATNPTRPVTEIRDGREGKEVTRFITFEPETPPSSVFEVPPSCHPPPRRH